MYTTSASPVRGANFFATKDGIFLQRLFVEQHDLTQPLPHSKRRITAQMTPFEMAEAVVDDLRSDQALLQFQVTGNEPAVVGGRPGFKLALQYLTPEKLRLAEVRYATVVGDRLYTLRFMAPSRHYFDRDLATFEETAKTFRL